MKSPIEHFTAMMRRRAAGETMGDIMRGHEEESGYRVVRPGAEPWFSAADWDGDAVVSVTPTYEVRLVIIIAKLPRTGAFRRLVAAIQAAGLTPVVCSPFPDMVAILKRWNWVPSIRQRPLGLELQVRPPEKRKP